MCDWSAVLFEKDAHRHHNLSPWMLGVSAFNFRSDFHSERLYQTAKFMKVLHRKSWILKEVQLYHQVLTSLMNIHTYNLQNAWHVKESSEVPSVWKYILKFIWLCNGYNNNNNNSTVPFNIRKYRFVTELFWYIQNRCRRKLLISLHSPPII